MKIEGQRRKGSPEDEAFIARERTSLARRLKQLEVPADAEVRLGYGGHVHMERPGEKR